MSATLPFPPQYDALADRTTGLLATVWNRWFRSILARVQAAPIVMKLVTLTGQSAAIAATTIALGTISAGLYRLAWYVRITTADGVSSSVTVTIGWTESGVSLTQSGAAVTGDTTTTVQSGTAVIRSDAAVPVTYATAYSSATPAKMRYRLDVSVEQVN